jgi:hypothetical protein
VNESLRYNQLVSEYRRAVTDRDAFLSELGEVKGALRVVKLERQKADTELARTRHENTRLSNMLRQAMADVSSLQCMLESYQRSAPPPSLDASGRSPPMGQAHVPPPLPGGTSPMILPQPMALPPPVEAAPAAAVKPLPSPLAAPATASTFTRKLSKKQQETLTEQTNKDSIITHLERLVALKDAELSKLGGKGPSTVASAVQACVGTVSSRTQTDDVVAPQRQGVLGSVTEAVFDLKGLMVESGFVTMRPLSLVVVHGPPTTSPSSGAAVNGTAGRKGFSPGGAATGGNLRGDRRSSLDGDMAALNDSPFHVPESGTPRWADEPVDFELSLANRSLSASQPSAAAQSPKSESKEAWKPRGSAGGRASKTL